MNEKKFQLQAILTVNLTQEDIDDIMVAALEGGINYWCGRAEVVGDYLGEYASDQISRGGTLVLYDAESDDKWELNLEKFLNGIKMFLEHGGAGCVEGETLDVCEIDAINADCIIQYAIFGEQVFD